MLIFIIIVLSLASDATNDVQLLFPFFHRLQEKANHQRLHSLIIDQSFFPVRNHAGDHVRVIRSNSDFFIAHVNSSQQLRSLLTSVSLGVGYETLNRLISNSLISPSSTAGLQSLSDFRLQLPSVLISNCADTSADLRIR